MIGEKRILNVSRRRSGIDGDTKMIYLPYLYIISLTVLLLVLYPRCIS